MTAKTNVQKVNTTNFKEHLTASTYKKYKPRAKTINFFVPAKDLEKYLGIY